MNDSWRQVLLGVVAALFSSVVVVGGLSVALLEAGFHLALAPTPAFTQTSAPFITLAPGQPTYTPSATPVASPTPTPLGEAESSCAPAGWVEVNLEMQQTFASLAEIYGVSAEELAEANCLMPSVTLLAGLTVSVPPVTPSYSPTPSLTPTLRPTPPIQPPGICGLNGPYAHWVPYVVRQGDTLYNLSVRTGVSISDIRRANNCMTGNVIRVGSILYLPFIPAPRPVVPSPTPVPPTLVATTPALPPTTAAPPPTTAVAPPTTAAPTVTTPPPTTAVSTPTNTGAPPTTEAPTATAAPPTATTVAPTPTTAAPTDTTAPPTATALPPTATAAATPTSAPPPSATARPTDIPLPPTATTAPPQSEAPTPTTSG